MTEAPVRTTTGRADLLSIRRRRRADRDAVRGVADQLRPGLWVATGPAAWRRAGTPVPAHFDRTKGFETRTPRTPRAAARAGVGRVARAVLLPAWFWNGRGRAAGFPIAFVAHEGHLLLLDPQTGRIERRYGTASVPEAYESLRRRFERHVASPAFRVGDDGRSLAEQFVEGEHLLDLPAPDQDAVVRDLLRGYAELTRHERESDSTDRVVPAVELALAADVPRDLRDLLREVDLRSAARGWPLVPSATDPHVKNVIAVDRRTFVPIDLANLRLDPFFSYPVGVVAQARPHVLEGYLGGVLDAELRALFEAAGTSLPPTERWRELLLALRIVMTARRAATVKGVISPEVFGRTVHARWHAVTAMAPGVYR